MAYMLKGWGGATVDPQGINGGCPHEGCPQVGLCVPLDALEQALHSTGDFANQIGRADLSMYCSLGSMHVNYPECSI